MLFGYQAINKKAIMRYALFTPNNSTFIKLDNILYDAFQATQQRMRIHWRASVFLYEHIFSEHFCDFCHVVKSLFLLL